MAQYRAQIGFPLNTSFPRDVITINPHYNGDNAQALADALKTNLIANTMVGATWPFTIKIYDDEKPPPSYPIASATNGTGFKVTNTPGEVALCLSYYAGFNRPSYRGRVFIPAPFVGGALSLRPTSTQMNNALSFANTLGKSLPSQHVWQVWSKKLKQGFTINHAWVDDEWDIQRSRGGRPTTRVEQTIP